jgi:hypothetical protein
MIVMAHSAFTQLNGLRRTRFCGPTQCSSDAWYGSLRRRIARCATVVERCARLRRHWVALDYGEIAPQLSAHGELALA